MITRNNYAQLDRLIETVAGLGAKSIGLFWMLRLGRAEGCNNLYPPKETYRKVMLGIEQLKFSYAEQGFRVVSRRVPAEELLPLERCTGGLTHSYLRSDGRLTPCINVLDENYTAGSIRNATLTELSSSEGFKRFREFVDSRGEVLEECKPCDMRKDCGFGCPGYAKTWNGLELSLDPLCYFHKENGT
jgi:radical SAM protein with 4Fe4S-binding SPASM domain